MDRERMIEVIYNVLINANPTQHPIINRDIAEKITDRLEDKPEPYKCNCDKFLAEGSCSHWYTGKPKDDKPIKVPTFSSDEMNLMRQWINPAYLNAKDYILSERLHTLLHMRVPESVKSKDKPICKKCDKCKGSGISNCDGITYDKCPKCDGTGKISQIAGGEHSLHECDCKQDSKAGEIALIDLDNKAVVHNNRTICKKYNELARAVNEPIRKEVEG